jgi:hypothetical protein
LFGGHADKYARAFNGLFVDGVVGVGDETGAEGPFGDGEFLRPFGDEGVDILETVEAGLVEVLGDGFQCQVGRFGVIGSGGETKAGRSKHASGTSWWTLKVC